MPNDGPDLTGRTPPTAARLEHVPTAGLSVRDEQGRGHDVGEDARRNAAASVGVRT